MGSNGLALLVDAVPCPPPPCLVDEGPVRRIHQPDDAVVHVTRQFGREMRDGVAVAEGGQPRRFFTRLGASAPLRHVYPEVSILLAAGERAGVDLADIELVVGHERRDLAALAADRLELPAVIRTFQVLPVEPAAGERHAAVRTTVARREGAAFGIASQHQGNAQQHGRLQLASAHAFAAQSGVPEAAQQAVVGTRRIGHERGKHYRGQRWGLFVNRGDREIGSSGHLKQITRRSR